MAKIYGLFGSMTGKLADTVMSVRNGEQLARKYQPMVYNPSTPAQVAQRAKLKLLSQLSAVMAPVIAIPRQGSVSSRNLFTKVNFGLTTYADNSADISLAGVQLTKSSVGFSEVAATRDGAVVSVQLSRSESQVDRVVYALFVKETDNSLKLQDTAVVSVAGDEDTYPTTFSFQPALPLVVLAYGIRENSDAARAYFSNMSVNAMSVAQVVTTRQLTDADITLTATKGIDVAAPTQQSLEPAHTRAKK